MKIRKLPLLVLLIIFANAVSGQSMLDLSRNAMLLAFQGKFKEAIPILVKLKLEDSLKMVANKSWDEDELLGFTQREAGLYEDIGNFAKAEEILKQVLAAAKNPGATKTKHRYKEVLNLLSLLYEKMGNDESNEAILEELVASEYGNQDTKAFSDSLHKKMSLIGKYAQNLPYAEGMYKIKIREDQAGKQFATLTQISLLKEGKLIFTGDRNGVNDSEPWSEVARLFMLYKKMHKYTVAESLIKQAIRIDDNHLGEDNNPLRQLPPDVLQQLAKMPQLKGLSSLMQQAVTLKDKHLGVDIFYIRNKVLLAELYKESGKNGSYKLLADTIYKLCIGFNSVDNPIIINYLAEVYAKIGKYRNAENSYKKIINSPLETAGEMQVPSFIYLNDLQEIAKLYELTGDFEAAESALKLALAFDKSNSFDDYPDHLTRVTDIAQLYESIDQFSLAEQQCSSVMVPVMNNIRDNFSFLSEREKISWLNNQISAFDFSASLLLKDPNPSEEFVSQTCDQQLQLKEIVLKDEEKVYNEIRKGGNAQLKQLLNEWQSNRSAIAWQYSLPVTPVAGHIIDSLKTIANEQEKKINQLSESFRNNRQNPQVDFRQVQHQLKSDEAAIEFVRFNLYHKKWTDSIKYGAFIILSNDPNPHFVPLCNEVQLTCLLDNKNSSSFFDFYGGSASNTAGKKSDTLYNLVWKPLIPFLKGMKKIAIAPAGLLERIAFNALPADNNTYLIDKYEIRQYSSVREIVEQKTGKQHSYTINTVLFGGIKFDTPDSTAIADNRNAVINAFPEVVKRSIRGGVWGPLPGTLNEVNEISKLFRANNITTRVITGSAATEESLKLLSGHSPWLLHLATHGFSLPDAEQKTGRNLDQRQNQFSLAEDPMFRSGVIMAGANRVWRGGLPIKGREDGIVTAYEISNLDLSNTELVVLSACETALGDIKGTEGVFGLQRAFKLAGVKNMLLSLWDIPDKQTSELMEQFYTGKLKGMDNCQALHSAQQIMRKKYAPYYWAAFELIE
jgi:CHAT domain-containing protein